MSDNLAPEVVQEELEARLRIPTEVWTDVFKLLPRRVLIQQIDPACFYFKEITNKNVKNVHVIKHADQFTEKLNADDPEANHQLEQLAGSNCQLASQFRLIHLWISEKSKAVLSHCPDLFIGCQITLDMDIKEENKDTTLFLECLDRLEKAKPVVINVEQQRVIDFWHHPTFQHCTRIDLSLWSGLSAATMMNVFDRLHHHHQPKGVDDQQVRSMIVWFSGYDDDHIDWLINRCSEDIQYGRKPEDRRPFVLSFRSWLWTGFDRFRRIKNKSTGEVLLLDRVLDGNGEPNDEEYRLRRCLAEEEANGPAFYAGMFKRESDWEWEAFNIGDMTMTPKVLIR